MKARARRPGEAFSKASWARRSGQRVAAIRKVARAVAFPRRCGIIDPVHTPFSEKLGLVLKSLSMSRGRLASELGVDKSLVGRWVSGTVTPSSHNLKNLTRLLMSRLVNSLSGGVMAAPT